MRKLDDDELEKIGGEKAFAWAVYCLQLDNIREFQNPDYDPNKLSEEEQLGDWLDFEKKYEEKKKNEDK